MPNGAPASVGQALMPVAGDDATTCIVDAHRSDGGCPLAIGCAGALGSSSGSGAVAHARTAASNRMSAGADACAGQAPMPVAGDDATTCIVDAHRTAVQANVILPMVMEPTAHSDPQIATAATELMQAYRELSEVIFADGTAM